MMTEQKTHWVAWGVLVACVLSGCSTSSNGGMRETGVEVISDIIAGGKEGRLLFAKDILTVPDKSIKLQARVTSWDPDHKTEGITLEFRDAKGVAIGRSKTDKDGWASVSYKPKAVGDYSLTARVIAIPKDYPADLLKLPEVGIFVSVRKADANFIVVDLDGTLCTGGTMGFLRVAFLDGGKPRPDSKEVMLRIAKHYHVIYLTHRPGDLKRRSRSWIKDNGYPPAPILMSTLSEAMGDSAKYKIAQLKLLRKQFTNLKVGIGDKGNDIKAYRENGLMAIWTPWYKPKPKDMRKAADEIEAMKGTGIITCSDWKEVERAIFNRYVCPPKTFAKQLREKAQKNQKDKDKDDDDDD